MRARFGRGIRVLGFAVALMIMLAACYPFHEWNRYGTEREWYCDPTDVALNDSHHEDPVWDAYYTVQKKPLTAKHCHDLDMNITAARAFAAQYPTIADAEAAGFWWAADWIEGQGYHYTDLDLFEVVGSGVSFDPNRPQWLQYDAAGNLVGMMFHQSGSASQPPDESLTFPGANDHWHRHMWLCIDLQGTPPILFDALMNDAMTRAQCAAAGGDGLYSGETEWMVHVWITPYSDGTMTWNTLPDIFDASHPALGEMPMP